MGEASKIAMQMALDEQKAKGLNYNYELIVEDNQNKPIISVSSAQKFINIDKADVLITFLSGNCNAVAPIAEQTKTLNLCAAWDDITQNRRGAYTFVQTTNWADVSNQYLKLFKSRNIDKVAIMYFNFGTTPKFSQMFSDLLTENGIKNDIDGYNIGEKDFKVLIEKYKDKGYQNFWVAGTPPESDIIMKQLNNAGVESSNIFPIGADAGNNYDLYSGMDFYGHNTGNAAFVQKLRENPKVSVIYVAASNYDLINLTINTYEALYQKDKKPTTEEVIEYINNLKEYPCASTKCTVLDNGFIVNPANHRRVVNGKIEIIE